MRTDEGTDVDLVHLAQRGDATAFGALLERHRPPLYALALSILRDRPAAQDAVQDAYVAAIRGLDDLRDPAAVGAWLRTIVRNAALAHVRPSREQPGDVPDLSGLSGTEPDAVLDRLALRAWVLAALDELSDDLRSTVVLRYFSSGPSYRQIGAALGVPIGTVRSRLSAAKQRLAQSLPKAAAGAHPDHVALAAHRWEEWTAAIADMHRSRRARRYFAECADDAVVENPAAGHRRRNVRAERRNLEEGLEVGVQLRPTAIVASTGVTVLEGRYENPPELPNHCPPLHTEIRLHRGGLTHRIILHFGT